MIDAQDFKKHADAALTLLKQALAGAADDYGFDMAAGGGAITVKAGHPPTKLVIAANPPTQQVLVSVGAKSYKLEWDIVENAFVYSDSGQTLKQIVEEALSKQLKDDVSL
jgi:frataxin-like iron-binding protein CyaY